MGLPRISLTNSNYSSFMTDKEIGKTKLKETEHWITLRKSENVPIGKGGIFSRDVGIKMTLNYEGEKPSVSVVPAFGANYKQKFTDNEKWNVYAGGRARISDELQFRGFAGVDYKVNDKIHTSLDLHYTAGTSNLGQPETPTTIGQKAGGYATVSYQPNPNLNIWLDVIQVNYNISKGGLEIFPNAGFSYTF